MIVPDEDGIFYFQGDRYWASTGAVEHSPEDLMIQRPGNRWQSLKAAERQRLVEAVKSGVLTLRAVCAWDNWKASRDLA